MPFHLNRRRWLWVVGTTPLLAQTPTPAVTPEQRMQKASADVRQVSDKLAAMEVPMDVEPSFRFVA